MPTIHEAAQNGDAEALGRELASGVSPNALDSAGWTPLHNLCYNGRDNAEARVACVRMLIDAGADIDHAQNDDQSTPLHFAAGDCPAIVIAALIKAGADVNVTPLCSERGANNRTPLYVACERSDVEPAKVLIRNGADVNAIRGAGFPRTALDYAIMFSRRLVPILLRAGATLPAHTNDLYIHKVIAAGGFETYKRIHLDALAATFAPHFAHLPPEIVRLVVKYAFHVGYY